MLKKLGVLTSVLALASFICPTLATAEDFHHRDRDWDAHEHYDRGRHNGDRHEFVEHRRIEEHEWREHAYRDGYRYYAPAYYGPAYYAPAYRPPAYYVPAPCPPRVGVYFSLGR